MPHPSQALTEREAQIMEILWDFKEATAERVRERLPDNPHDSTVRTLLRVLKEKGYVRIQGRQPAVYVPIIEQKQARHAAAKRLIDRFFGGSVDQLVLHLLEDERLTPQQLKQLKKRYAARPRKGERS